MTTIVFITGNQGKADYLANFLDFPVEHIKLDLDELQSMDLRVIVEHKIRQAYAIVKKPVIVEDVALEFETLNGLPGPFIKFFVEQAGLEKICRMIPEKKRKAIARCVYGFFDGKEMKLFEGKLKGEIAQKPAGDGGYGWDRIFIPFGYDRTRAELNQEDDRKTYLKYKPLEKIKKYLKQKK